MEDVNHYSCGGRTNNGHDVDQYWSESEPILVGAVTNMRLLPRVLRVIQSAKASHAQPHDIPLRSDTQALRLIVRIPLIQRREKYPSREGKSAFP